MTIDMTQFYRVFFDETAEHLATMESLLLNLDVAQPSLEDLNAIFRAAHSIKGGSGTFGFSDMSELTHVLESLLDRLRKQTLRLRPDMVDAFLAAGDVLRAQLAQHQGGAPVEAAQVEAVRTRLGQLAAGEAAASPVPAAGSPPSAPAPPADPSSEPGPEPSPEPAASPAAPVRRLRLACTLPADTAAEAARVDHLLAALGELAALELEHRPDAGDPRLVALLTTLQDDAALREVLSFYAASEAVTFSDPLADPAPPAVPEADPGFGLFDDAPGRLETLPERSVAPGDSPAALEGEGYGIFVDAPGGMGLFAESPGSEELLPAFAPALPGKGGAGTPGGRRLSDHPAIERVRAGRRDNDKTASAPSSETSIRVAVDKVDQLMNLVGELVITQSMLAQTAGQVEGAALERLQAGLEQLARNTRDLQESVMSIRMLPMSMVFSRFPRLVRDLAGKLGKQVELVTQGENTELDKGLIEKVADPLTHLVRNSLDHGIETPERRVAAGKAPHGTVKLRAAHQGGAVVIEVIDDGAGLDRARILAKARERGMAVSDAMSDYEAWQLIFAPGFSTAETITDLSGRGVGMDVVKRNIEALGGRVELESAPGHGTRTVIRLPLTLAILDGMCVGVGGETFVIPITSVMESLQAAPEDLRTLAGDSRMLHLRGDYLPLIAPAELFGLAESPGAGAGIVVVVEGDDGRAALLVDELLGQQQVVIKSLEANYRRVEGVSGATIMGDGRVALILDVTALTRLGLARPGRRQAA